MIDMKFGHMADLHLGATSDPVMRRLEIETLEKSLQRCIDEDVDFLIISGDIFHVNIPDLAVVRDSVRAFMKFVETGRKIYVVYGSHDFSPNSTSIIDILDEAGVFVRVGKPSAFNGRLRPSVITDERSGALITGISGRRASLEKEAFINLDREFLASLKGFKVFVFHTGIEEDRLEGERYEGISSTDLPTGFDYYAGGHLHRAIDHSGKKGVVFPGPLFTGWGADMEATVRGARRGFFIVEANGAAKTKFIDMTAFEGIYKPFDAAGKTAQAINDELKVFAEVGNVKDKVIVVKVQGDLASGKTSEVDFVSFRDTLTKRGALYLHLSRNQLRSREVTQLTVNADDSAEVEERVLHELEGIVRTKDENLSRGSAKIAKELLARLRVPKKEGETEGNYESRIVADGIETLGIKRLAEG